jgi:ketol-acid reductoisomerase
MTTTTGLKIYYDNDADLSLITAKKVAIIGYGSQGHAHALNLKDSGVQVPWGCRRRAGRAEGRGRGAAVKDVADAARWADVIMVLVPDTASQPALYRESIAPHLTAGKMLMFAHGFNIRFGTITPPPAWTSR